jgi:hypothetical protein
VTAVRVVTVLDAHTASFEVTRAGTAGAYRLKAPIVTQPPARASAHHRHNENHAAAWPMVFGSSMVISGGLLWKMAWDRASLRVFSDSLYGVSSSHWTSGVIASVVIFLAGVLLSLAGLLPLAIRRLVLDLPWHTGSTRRLCGPTGAPIDSSLTALPLPKPSKGSPLREDPLKKHYWQPFLVQRRQRVTVPRAA